MEYKEKIRDLLENINDAWILRQIYIFIVNIMK